MADTQSHVCVNPSDSHSYLSLSLHHHCNSSFPPHFLSPFVSFARSYCVCSNRCHGHYVREQDQPQRRLFRIRTVCVRFLHIRGGSSILTWPVVRCPRHKHWELSICLHVPKYVYHGGWHGRVWPAIGEFSLLPFFRLFISFLPSFLPSFTSSFQYSCIPSFLPIFFPFIIFLFLPSNIPSFFLISLPSVLPSVLPSFLPSFLPRSLQMVWTNTVIPTMESFGVGRRKIKPAVTGQPAAVQLTVMMWKAPMELLDPGGVIIIANARKRFRSCASKSLVGHSHHVCRVTHPRAIAPLHAPSFHFAFLQPCYAIFLQIDQFDIIIFLPALSCYTWSIQAWSI